MMSKNVQERKPGWPFHADALCSFAWERFPNRFDAYLESGITKKFTVDEVLLAQHFAGKITIGLHSTSKDLTCKWIGFDWDCKPDDPDLAWQVETAAITFNDWLRLNDLPSLMDTGRPGSVHQWLFFPGPIPAQLTHHFASELQAVAERYTGIRPEIRPTSPHFGPRGYSSALRLPGKNYKSKRWSRVWGQRWDDGELRWQWLEGEEAVCQMLATEPVYLDDLHRLFPAKPTRPRPVPRVWVAVELEGRTEKRISGYLKKICQTAPGDRNRTAYNFGRFLCGELGLERKSALEKVLDWNSRIPEPLPEWEVASAVGSAARGCGK